MATTESEIDRPSTRGIRRVADLRLRAAAASTPVRVRWPRVPTSEPAPPLIVLLPDAAPADGVDRVDDETAVELCSRAVAVVLCTPWMPCRPGALERAEAALAWAADHGAELGADPSRLAIAGRGIGAAAAAALALRARERGWPPIRRELLVLPDAVWVRAPDGEVDVLDSVEAAATSLRATLAERKADR